MTKIPAEYAALLEELKVRIRAAQLRAALSANREMVTIYWEIGRRILEQQKIEGWGTKVIERLASDLHREFPKMKGFSSRNLKYMRAFAEAYPDQQFVQEALAQITWYHHITLLDKVKDPAERVWYIQKATEHGWSRNTMVFQIESGLHHREGKAITNFSQTLTQPQSDLARQALKDPYVFDFLTLDAVARERELEQGLIDHIQKFLIELGKGFAYIGRQIQMTVGGEDFYLDLLFYHLHLRCYVVIELKAGPFKPEYAGKMNFYLSAVDDNFRHPDDKPTIGLLLCKEKNRLIVEYALRDLRKPLGVADWRTGLVEILPKQLKGKLPTIEDFERELGKS